MRKLITQFLIGVVLLACASPLLAQTAGQTYRAPIRFVQIVRVTQDSVWYRVQTSEATPTTNGRIYPATRKGWDDARWVLWQGPIPEIPGQTPPTTPAPPADTVRPPVVQPPADTVEPTDPSGALYATDFETGLQSANGVTMCGQSSRVALSTDRAFSGRASLRFRYGPDANGRDSSAECRFRLPNITPEIWLEWMLYVPDNFVVRDQDHFENNKILALWAGDYSTNRNIDTEIVLEYFRRTDTEATTRLSVAHGDYYERIRRNDHEDNATPGSLFTAALRGKWVRIRVYAKLDHAGAVKLWRDNQLVYDLPRWDLWGTGGINRFETGYLMGWANSGFTDVTDFYVDDFRIYNANPGW